MLEKIGQALKSATNKIAKAIFIDKGVIEEVTKDLQRALIGADVNVHLVKEITDEIKKLASDEKIKGVEKREQINRYKGTISIHRKKQTNTLYTLNAMNKLIADENNGVYDKNFQLSWELYKNSIILTNDVGVKIVPLKLFSIHEI